MVLTIQRWRGIWPPPTLFVNRFPTDAAANRIHVDTQKEYQTYRRLRPGEANLQDQLNAQQAADMASYLRPDDAMQKASQRNLSDPYDKQGAVRSGRRAYARFRFTGISSSWERPHVNAPAPALGSRLFVRRGLLPEDAARALGQWAHGGGFWLRPLRLTPIRPALASTETSFRSTARCASRRPTAPDGCRWGAKPRADAAPAGTACRAGRRRWRRSSLWHPARDRSPGRA